MAEKYYLFRAVKGRVYHQSDTLVLPDHIQREPVVAICGATFERWYVFEPAAHEPNCPKCRRVLAKRNAEQA